MTGWLLAFLLIATLEGGLWIVGYGHDLSLFVEDTKNKDCWVINPYASRKYFTETDNAPIGNFELFRKQKTPDTFRLFVLGESTTIGYPYMHNGSFHRWLQYRLMHTFPKKNIEVINLAMTAVNSYTVLDFGKEIVNYQPDAVLIYTGHNEYYGALGVGSTSRMGSNTNLVQLLLKLREFRLVQLISSVASKIRKIVAGEQVDVRENLMKRMAADQQIPYKSDNYIRGIRQFETNMNELCQLLSKHKIPTLISNLVSNEKDLKPLISEEGIDENSATYQYEQASMAYDRGDFKEAKKLYGKAKELDLLRFRAPEAINKVIHKLSASYAGVYLVDAKATFEKHSPHGILGKETLLEHVHPNLYGYALLSDAFYQTLKRNKIIAHAYQHEISFAQLIKQMPVTTMDSLKGAYEVMLLKQGWPFNEPIASDFTPGRSFEAQLANGLIQEKITWNEAMDQLMQHYVKTNNGPEALRVAEAVMLEYPYDATFSADAGNISLQLHKNEQAILYFKKAFVLTPTAELAQNLLMLQLKLDLPEQAIPYLNYMIANKQSNINYIPVKQAIQEIIQLKAALQIDPTNIDLINQVAIHQLAIRNTELAARYANQALLVDQHNITSLEILKKIKQN